MRRSLMVVDDDTDLLDMLTTLFRHEGYEISTAESGEEALEKLNTQAVQLFLIDYRMTGMDGLELCRRIKNRNPAAYAVVMSGYLQVFTLAELREAGFDDLIPKPFELPELRELVWDAFDRIARWRKLGLGSQKTSDF